MRPFRLAFVLAVGIAMLASLGLAQQSPTAGPYKVLKTAKVGGEGGFDYVFADAVGRRLYVPRSGPTARITVFDLDTLEPTGEVPNVSGHGAVVDPKTHHVFSIGTARNDPVPPTKQDPNPRPRPVLSTFQVLEIGR